MSRWDSFWRWFNPPLPDVMQAEMLCRLPKTAVSMADVIYDLDPPNNAQSGTFYL